MNISAGFNMFPLQIFDLTDFWKNKGSVASDVELFVIGLGIILAILLIVILLRNKLKISFLTGEQSSRSPRHFSKHSLRRIARSMDLDKEQTKMLEFVLSNDGVTDLERSINSPSLLDRHFKQAYRSIERRSAGKDDMNNRLEVLFSTRNAIEAGTGNVTTTSTRQIPENAAAVLAFGSANYPVRVISSRGDTLVVATPSSSTGQPIRLQKGSKINLSFFTQSNKGFSVDSRVLASTETAEGPVLQLVHSGQIKKLSNRRYRRHQAFIVASFYYVQVEAGQRKKSTRMIVDKKRFTGNIMDISIGGCAIKTSIPVNSGQRLKIEFNNESKATVAALGQVLRVNRTKGSTIMHIKFLRIPRNSANFINAMVYEYTVR